MPPSSWASTLCLPSSKFPPRPILADRDRYLKLCTDKLYARRPPESASPRRLPFILHDGPPYANGRLHIGHALNKVLKDITCRWALLQGRSVVFRPGWDCHGLPIELKALQLQQPPANDHQPLDASETRTLARNLALEAIKEQKASFRKWAVMADWENPWKTMDKAFELKQLDVFRALVSKGLVYQRFKPVYWSPSTRTALAEAELEYHELCSTAAFVKFPLSVPPSGHPINSSIRASQVSLVIWTTTPWTLFANRAVAIRSDLQYVLVGSKIHGVLVSASSCLDALSKASDEDLSQRVITTLRGSDLVGLEYRVPLPGLDSTPRPILHGNFVTDESGSGLVHVAPGHGMEDYELCQRHGIAPHAPVDDSGCFALNPAISEHARFQGKEVLGDGNDLVLASLTASNNLIKAHPYNHRYPFDWRSKQPVIIRATRQWFADIAGIRDIALRSLDKVHFIPSSGKERLSSFIRNRSEWCISRQRAWGVPIPALYPAGNCPPVMDSDSIDHIMSVIKDRGIDSWWLDDEADPAWIPPGLRGGRQYARGKDTMDVWFDSGTSWTETKTGSDNQLQIADVYLEGSDQHRGWFQSSLLTRIAFVLSRGEQSQSVVAPFRTLVTHGFVLDQEGRKMSKSEGNVISPDQIIDGSLLPPLDLRKLPKEERKALRSASSPLRYDAMGPDALRLWVASCDYAQDVTIGPQVLKVIHQRLSKLRVTFKLLIGLLDTYKEQAVSPYELTFIDKVALHQLQHLFRTTMKYFDSFEYHRAVTAIFQYINIDFSAFYIESTKDRLYADAVLSRRRIEAQYVLWYTFRALSYLLAPINPLLVEEAVDYLPRQLKFDPWSISSGSQPFELNFPSDLFEAAVVEDIPHVLALSTAVKGLQEQARLDKKMGSSLQSVVTIVAASSDTEMVGSLSKLLMRRATDLADFFVVSKVDLYDHTAPDRVVHAEWVYKASVQIGGQEATVYVHNPESEKCARCWKYNVDVKANLEVKICTRCLGVMEGLRSTEGT